MEKDLQEKDLQELEQITFGIYSADEIKNLAVCEVNSPKNVGYNTVYDPRMGTLENGKLCETCHQGPWTCPGHFGYIVLNEPVAHPLFYRRIVDFLRCICLKCNKLIITEDQINLSGFNKISSAKRFDKILEKLDKIDICTHCSYIQPSIKYTSNDNLISMVYKQKNKKNMSIILPIDEIKKIFDNITDNDVKLLGFNPSLMHPRNLIITVFPVIPPTARPYIINEGHTSDDDLTVQLIEIIKANNMLKIGEEPINELKRQKASQSVKFRITTFFNNSCLDPDTPVLMWNGHVKKAKEIIVGDELIGDDGEKRIVKKTCEGEDEMFEIQQTFSDNYTVNGNHILSLKYTKHKNIKWCNPTSEYKKGSWLIQWFNGIKSNFKYIELNSTLSYEDAFIKITEFAKTIDDNDIFDIKVRDYLNLSDNIKNDLVGFKINKSINWDYKKVDLDPYILGMWLGDTNIEETGFTNKDNELVNRWKKWSSNNNHKIALYKKTISEEDILKYTPDIDYIDSVKTYENTFKKILKKYDLIENKYIPYDYLYNDTDTRLKLLAGIIDIDGFETENGYEISQTSDRKYLIEQLQFLAGSLGYSTTVSYKDTYKKLSNGKKYIIHISGFNLDKIPIFLKKKYISEKQAVDSLLTSIKVKYIGVGKYNGFIIDKNHRFLLKDFTVTHNSGKAKHTSGRPIKGLKERLTGKEGLIRTNLMGKRCIFLGTKMILWNGEIKNVEDIKIGDILIGNDGEKRTVLKLFNGTDQMYKIKQGTGNDYIVNSEHTLTFKYNDNKKLYWKKSVDSWYVEWFDKTIMKKKSKKIKPTKNRTKEEAYNQLKEFIDSLDTNNTINIDVKDYLKLSDKTKKLLYGYKIENSVNWEHKEVEIDPYILGMWLGDGYKPGNGFASIDKELIEYWSNWADKNDMRITFYNDKQNVHYGIANKNYKKKTTVFKQKLAKYGLVNNKFIPKEYMINSKEVRLSLLAGLIDTDGSVEQGGVTIRISQCLKHKNILEGAKFIADSLGFQTSIKNKKTSLTHKGIHKTGTALVLSISGYGIEDIPTLLARKKCKSPINIGNNWTKVTVEPYKVGEFYGFEIDGNNLFVLPDFTVLHNCEQTGRTVIGPDPTLRMGEIGVPKEMANTLTVPVQVTNYNYNQLQEMVNNEKVERVFSNRINKDGKKDLITFYLKEALNFRGTILQQGDIIIRKDEKTHKEIELVVNNGKELLKLGDKLKRNGEMIHDIKYPGKKQFRLNIGDICERYLIDNDILLLNRQPTLHSGSMLAMNVVIHEGKTLRFNLSIAKSFNADFDGDEMNIHIPQSVEAQTELKMVSAAKHHIISPQSSKPNMCIVQDSLLGSYKMSLGIQTVRKDEFFNIAMKLDISISQILKKIQSIRKVFKEKGKKVQCFHGKGLLSLILPDDFFYEKKNNADPSEPVLKIFKGVIYEGALDKSTLGAVNNSLIQVIHKEYGSDITSLFIDGVQFISNNWLLINGFSIGIEDCMVRGESKEQEIKDVIQKCFVEAEGIKATTSHAGIREVRITGALGKAKDIGLRIAKDALDPNNNFLSTVKSGSKGDFFNIAQITGLLGQQNLLGQRVNPVLNNGKRTLPHYPMENLETQMEYESRGFIDSSFIKGLNPKQFYFHAMSGREGCCDTAMNTATSGYIQRKIVKLTEDIKVQYDNTVRDAVGSLYQLNYGEDGLNPISTIKVGKNQECCDISSIINKLNIKHEDALNKQKILKKN